MKRRLPRICLGFGDTEGKCQNVAGCGEYWCEKCNKLRFDHLNRQFANLKQGFEGREEGPKS